MLHVHRASRADILAGALAELLVAAPSDPFAPDVVAVPTRGMERWLTQRMSATLGASAGRSDGVCANVLFPTPHRLVADAVAAASGIAADEDPWLPERAMWPLLEIVDECLGEPWLFGLTAYLGALPDDPDPTRRARRLSVVRHVVGLFDRYALHRPAMLERWAAGSDGDSAGAGLPAGAAWQPELWRRLRARIALPGPAERRSAACARITAEPQALDLPDRMSLFGLTRLPIGQLEVLRALAVRRDVHLFLLHPSPSLWDALSTEREPAQGLSRSTDRTAELARNRLLASWGRDAREMQLVLASGGPEPIPPGRDTDHGEPDATAGTLLARLQADVRADRAAPGAPLDGGDDARAPLDGDDRSVVVHSCHGRVRQVEVLRDAILHALAEDETLEPRDVIVMCPDIEAFAPLIGATFGAGEPSGEDDVSDGAAGPDLRVRLADRSLTQTNPVLAVVSELMGLVGQRVTASQVLDLADRGPVRRRFAFDDDDLSRLQDWIAQAGIRWGLDAPHRAPFKLDGIPDGTWSAGLDRLLLGVTMTEDGQRLFADVLPLDDVDSRSIELVGRLAELLDRLRTALDALSRDQPLADWAAAVADAADALTATTGRDRWQRAELQRILDELVRDGAGSGLALAPEEAHAHLAARLQGRPTRANFRTGHLTVCTLMPMRSVPHRVVCLLGLDDGAFPRKAPRDGDDLMLTDPHLGERDPRSEDRQLLLDALLAATERLIVTYTGNDERTNTLRPPAVPVGELLDAIDATVCCADDRMVPARERIVVRHPLQPFDPKNFESDRLAVQGPWSFDPDALAGARALTAERHATPRFLAGRLPALSEPVIELEDLVHFVEHPVKSFLRRRLDVSLGTASDEIRDGLPIELGGLERWDVGDRLLRARLNGVETRTAVRAERARGTLPPGILGDRVLDDVHPIVASIMAQVDALRPAGANSDPVDLRIDLPDGRRLNGTVTGMRGDCLFTTMYSRVSAKHRLAAWVRFLALNAAIPERPTTAFTVGRGPQASVIIASLGTLADEAEERRARALAELTAIVALFDRGMREPLPMFCKTSAAYAEAARSGRDGSEAARDEWTSGYNFDREDKDPEHRLLLGGVVSFDDLLVLTATQVDEPADEWSAGEPTRLGNYARLLWDPLLVHEETWAR